MPQHGHTIDRDNTPADAEEDSALYNALYALREGIGTVFNKLAGIDGKLD